MKITQIGLRNSIIFKINGKLEQKITFFANKKNLIDAF